MKEERLLNALGKVHERYVEEAAPGQKKMQSHWRGWAAAVAVVVLTALFLQTAPGAAAVEHVLEKVTDLIETLFPPREETVYLGEGTPVEVTYEAQGQLPETEPDGYQVPGFVIYVDPEHYEMHEEDGVSYIRPVGGGAENLPVCGMEIRHLADSTPEVAAASIRAELAAVWASVTELQDWQEPQGLFFGVAEGTAWDDAQEEHYFVSDGQNGTFHLTVQYFMEASEGHGVRLASMLRTFTVLAP